MSPHGQEHPLGDSPPVPLASIAVRKGKIQSWTWKKTELKGCSWGETCVREDGPRGTCAHCKRFIWYLFPCVCCLQEAEQWRCWLRGTPIRVRGEPEFRAVQAELCRQGCAGRAGAPSPEAAAGFVCEGRQNFNELPFSFFRAGNAISVTGWLLRPSPHGQTEG